ncbi:MAG TPA: zinc-ribbon domain-containing protein [Gemmatimonadaceae bacterium]|jgi:predicted Zn finger-like uncharacterized protein|nr:zinc-ribbon domain-containing protein [Gemmatimonadaceae bacterium]
MNVTCPECRSIYRVDPAKVPVGGVQARCSVCGAVFPVSADAERRTPAAAGRAIEPPSPQAGAATPMPVPAASAPARPAAAGRPTPAPGVLPAPPAAGAAATAPTADAFVPGVVTAPAAPPAPVRPVVAPSQPAAAPALRPPARPAAPAPSNGGGTATPGAARPPINPFLSNDPNQKARRLARALVSDIVAYHPQLREQGLREGTIKVLLKDEIKKSYEEYVDQVGREFAESTMHFQDALNEILASGRKLF